MKNSKVIFSNRFLVVRELENGNLNTRLTVTGRKVKKSLKDMSENDSIPLILADMFYADREDGRKYDMVLPETIGALTNSLILGECLPSGVLGRIWWIPNYAVISYWDKINSNEGLEWELAPED